tara:strand:- start:1100 stop:1771 length:672 start_codon:yes stop_codon:yes gene_type:complete
MPIKVTGWDSSTGRMKKIGTTDEIDLDGNINLGDANTDNIDVQGEFVSNLIPNADDTYDLGSGAKKWRAGYFDEVKASGAITGKQRSITSHKYTATSTNDAVFVRFNAAGSNTSGGTNNRFVAPANGQLLKIVIRSDGTPGNTEIAFCKIADGVSTFGGGSPSADVMLNMSTDDTAYTADFSGLSAPHDSTFSAGNVLGIRINPTSNHGNVDLTAVWLFDWNA